MGASSARFAAGRIEGGRLGFEVIEQIAHGPSDTGFRASGIPKSQYPIPRLTWNFDLLLGLCNRAVEYASASFDEATIGIDTWGVDHGFLDSKGNLAQPMAAYRDESHAMAMATIEEHQARLYRLTGIQKQPFNTLCQLIARRLENPKLPEQATWLLLPDLFGFYLHSQRPTLNPQHFGSELSIASTTQMVGLDGQWCDEAFEIAGWPVPDLQPEKPGRMIGHAANSVEIIRVGGHDSAAAVCGLGRIDDDTAFMNVGTWSILGCLLESPMTSEEAREANFTNERGADGRIRFLANIPGFYVMNRLKEGESAVETPSPAAELMERRETPRKTAASSTYGIKVEGVDDVMLRLAKCCRPVPGDEIVGYVSLGRGITIHRGDCKNVAALMKAPERFTDVAWEGDNATSYRVELEVDAWDRTRLLEDLSRTFSETGVNIIEANCSTKHPMVKNRFVVEVGDSEQLRNCVSRLRHVEGVFDAYRVTPGA